MDTKKLKLRIQQKRDAIKHFRCQLKKFEDREVEAPEDRVTDEQKDAWYEGQITVLELKIKYESGRLEDYKQMLKEARK